MQVTPPKAERSSVIDRLRREPGVSAIEASSHPPFDRRLLQVVVRGDSSAAIVSAGADHVSPGYFAALGIPIVRGRTFTADEARARQPVAIVSESAARQLWPRADAIGATVRIARDDTDALTAARTVRVIGVARDVVAGFIGERRDHPLVYEPLAVDASDATLMVATNGNADQARRLIERALAGIDPRGAIELHTLAEAVAVQVYPFRAAHWVASALGVIALLLTVSGIYGVLA